MPDNSASRRKHDPFVFTFLIAVALAAAVATAVSLNGIATGAVPDLVRTAGFGQASEIGAEQRRHSLALEKIAFSLSRMRADIALLNTRVDDAEKLGQDAVSPALGIEGESNLGALQSWLDEYVERSRNEFSSVNKRIDWLEKLAYGPDASIEAASPDRGQGSQSAPGWFVLYAEQDVAVIADKGGAIDVTPGFMVPDLGSVSAIRQEGGRWVVVMGNGMTIRER